MLTPYKVILCMQCSAFLLSLCILLSLRSGQISRFLSLKPFQPSLIFANKAENLTKILAQYEQFNFFVWSVDCKSWIWNGHSGWCTFLGFTTLLRLVYTSDVFSKNIGDSDRLFTCSGHLGWCDKNRNNPISVAGVILLNFANGNTALDIATTAIQFAFVALSKEPR